MNELLARLCYAIIWLSEYSQMVHLDLDNKCESILKIISTRNVKVWIPNYNQ